MPNQMVCRGMYVGRKTEIDCDYLSRSRAIKEAGWYFVIRHSDDLCEIQICDEEGRGEFVVSISAGDTQAEVEGRVIPLAVIKAVQCLAIGRSDYCDSGGNRLDPFSMRVIAW
jgi:hypothetical protein